MKHPPIIIEHIRLVPFSLLRADMQEEEIKYLAQSIEPIYYTPGTAQLGYELKNSEAGSFYELELRYSVPGIPVEDFKYLSEVGAVVATSERNNIFVLYRNDYQSNTPLEFEISGSTDRAMIKVSIKTLNLL